MAGSPRLEKKIVAPKLTHVLIIHRVCLSRIVQIVDSSRLVTYDITYSNVDVAIWNMLEAHIGAVTANIALMGPLFTRLGKYLYGRYKPTTTWYGTKNRDREAFTSTDHHSPLQKKNKSMDHGFQRMQDGYDRPAIGDSGPMLKDPLTSRNRWEKAKVGSLAFEMKKSHSSSNWDVDLESR